MVAVPAQFAPDSAADRASADDTAWLQSARELVSDLFQRSPLIYWTDFLASITVAWGLAAAYFLTPPWSLLQITAIALAAHGFGNRGDRMTYVEQVGDSINIFPALPYQNLGEAHRRQTGRLPPDAPYHATGRVSFFAAIRELWRSARRTPREDSAMRRWNP